MSDPLDPLRAAIDLAKAIQSDLDALGVSKAPEQAVQLPQQVPPMLWTDERIRIMFGASTTASLVAITMRDEYEQMWQQSLEGYQATIRGLEREANALSETLREALEHIEQLAAQLAEAQGPQPAA